MRASNENLIYFLPGSDQVSGGISVKNCEHSYPAMEVGGEVGDIFDVIDELRTKIEQRIEQRQIERRHVNWGMVVRWALGAAGGIAILIPVLLRLFR